MIDLPPYALWLLLLAALSWAIPHFLKVSREKYTKRTTEKTEARLPAAEVVERPAIPHLTDQEREILHHCGSVDSWAKGHLWIMRVDAFGSWVRAGTHDFFSQTDPSIAARYLDAFESLYRGGCFRHEGDSFYRLTGIGYDRAQQNT